MTTRPEFAKDANFVNGLAAVALFAVLAVVFVSAGFGEAAGFPADASITASLGYALFNIGADAVGVPLVESEGMLAAFEIIDVVLVAALVASIMLARQRAGGQIVSALTIEGGREADGGRETDGGSEAAGGTDAAATAGSAADDGGEASWSR